MAYIITKTNGDTLVTVPDTENNTDYGVTLVGRNYSGYGVFLNDNFISLMENFANATSPTRPLAGQLWFNTTTKHLNLWNGTSWKIAAALTASGTDPDGSTTGAIGDMWWDTTAYQLKVWTGLTENSRTVASSSVLSSTITVNSTSGIQAGDHVTHANISSLVQVTVTQVLNTTQVQISTTAANVGTSEAIVFTRGSGWHVVGPSYTAAQKKSGIVPLTIVDTNAVTHIVDAYYAGGEIIATVSGDVKFTPRPADHINGFETINPGFQTKSAFAMQVTKTIQSDVTGSGGQTLLPLLTVDDLVVGDYFISNTVPLLNYAAISNIFTNNNTVQISTATSVVTNQIVTFQRGSAAVSLFNGIATDSQLLNGISSDEFPRLGVANVFKDNLTTEGNLFVNDVFSVSDIGDDVVLRNPKRGGDIIVYANVTQMPLPPQTTVSVTTLVDTGVTNRPVIRVESLSGLTVGDIAYSSPVISINDNITLRNIFTNNSSIQLGNFVSNKSFASGRVIQFEQQNGPQIEPVDTMPSLRALYINGTTGNVEVAVDPTTPLGVATKQYVDNTNDTTRSWLASNVAALVGTAPSNRNTLGELSDGIDSVTAALAQLSNVVDTKAPLDDAELTGVPTAPTASAGTNTTQLATTEFVTTALDALEAATTANAAAQETSISLRANIASPAFTGAPTAPTPASGTNTTAIATTAFVKTADDAVLAAVDNLLTYKAPLASPQLTGTPLTPNATPGTNSSQIASTAFVFEANAGVRASLLANTAAIITDVRANYAPLVSPSLSGTPTTPTANTNTSNTQIASTAFVKAAINAAAPDLTPYAPVASPALTGIPTAANANVSINTTQLATTAFIHAVLPKGMIMLWSGASSAIPFGWALCNGTNGTPDLRNRFVVGAGQTYNVAATGGATTGTATTGTGGSHDHAGGTGSTTLSASQIPSHTHDFYDVYGVWGDQRGNYNLVNGVPTYPGGSTPATNSGLQDVNGTEVAQYFYYSDASDGDYDGGAYAFKNRSLATGSSSGHTHSLSSDGSHNHSVTVATLPPYYALCYIMKTSG